MALRLAVIYPKPGWFKGLGIPLFLPPPISASNSRASSRFSFVLLSSLPFYHHILFLVIRRLLWPAKEPTSLHENKTPNCEYRTLLSTSTSKEATSLPSRWLPLLPLVGMTDDSDRLPPYFRSFLTLRRLVTKDLLLVPYFN